MQNFIPSLLFIIYAYYARKKIRVNMNGTSLYVRGTNSETFKKKLWYSPSLTYIYILIKNMYYMQYKVDSGYNEPLYNEL